MTNKMSQRQLEVLKQFNDMCWEPIKEHLVTQFFRQYMVEGGDKCQHKVQALSELETFIKGNTQ